MRFARVVAAVVLFVGVSAGCGDDDTGEGPTTTSAPSSTTTTTTTTAPTSTTSSTTTTSVPTLEQPAIWPAADVVFDTPQAAVADFDSSVLGVPPELGEFQQGDSRSGEILRELAFAQMVQRGLDDADADRTLSDAVVERKIDSWRK